MAACAARRYRATAIRCSHESLGQSENWVLSADRRCLGKPVPLETASTASAPTGTKKLA